MKNNKKSTNNKFEYLFSESSLGIFFYDYHGNITSVNKKIKNIFDFFKKGNNIYDYISNDEFIKEMNKSLKNGKGYFEGSINYNEKKYIKTSFKSIKSDNKFITGFGILENITNRKRFEKRLFLERKHFKKIIFSIDNGIISIDENGIINMVNHVAKDIVNLDSSYAYGRKIDKILNLKKNNSKINLCELIINKKIDFNKKEKYSLVTNNENKIINLSVNKIKNNNNLTIGYSIIFNDITDKVTQENKIKFLNYHDSLTNIYNRRYMENEIKKIDKCKNLPISLINIDVNGLKLTNDAFGHEQGDKLLVKVSNVLQSVCRKDDLIARMGGDEFTILLPKTYKKDAQKIKNRIIESISNIKIDYIVPSVAIGLATKKSKKENIKEVLTIAEDNMYLNKIRTSQLMKKRTIKNIQNKLYEKSYKEKVHARKTMKYAIKLANHYNLTDDKLKKLKKASIFHDIGKIMLPKYLLESKKQLTSSELKKIMKHPEIGYHLLKSIDDYAEVAKIVLHHHENFDGSGYPKGLKGKTIPFLSRIISICDYFVNLELNKTKNEIVKKLNIKSDEKKLDPNLVKVFIDLL
ncbi:MAG: diguanylate cyclase domain-containing protein [Bacillota bacterium]